MSALWAVVPAAGSGSRMGGATPKQYLILHGRTVLEWSVEALLACAELRGCVVALPADDLSGARQRIGDARVSFCAGGASRADSVAAALAALPASDDDWVLVHDAARPCLPLADVQRLIARCRSSGVGGVLAQPVTETLKRVVERRGGLEVVDTLDRKMIWRAQTPQMFPVGLLRTALANAAERGSSVTDEASAMEQAGHPVQVIEGSAANLKVTYAADLALAEFWLATNGGGVVSGSEIEPCA